MRLSTVTKIRVRAEQDQSLTAGSFRLLLRLLTRHGTASKAWPCPSAEAAALAGIRDRHTIRARLIELEAAGYLAKVGPAGCPPRYLYYWP